MTDIERLPCALHPGKGSPAREGYLVCGGCATKLRDALDDIVRLAALLTNPYALIPEKRSDLARSSPGYKSSSPANDTVIALTDWRSIAWYRGDPDDVLGVLGHWADKVRASTGLAARSGPRTITGEIAVLVRMFDWLQRQDLIGRLTHEVLNLQGVLLELAGEARARVPIGRCTTPTLDPDTGQEWQCYQLLQVRPDDRAVRCPRCLTSWSRLHWPELAAALRDGAR